MRTSHKILAVFGAALIFAGCGTSSAAHSDRGAHGERSEVAGDHGGHADRTPTVPGARRVAVEASSFAFSPAMIELVAGEPVNVSLTVTDVRHDLTVDGAGFHVVADGGQTADAGLVIDASGTYVAYCSLPGHRKAGMELEIVVRGS